MFKKFKEWLSIYVVKRPAGAILLAILLLNVVLLFGAALLISALAPASAQHAGFWESVFYTVSMILDAGCIQYIVADIGEASVALIIVCLVTILIGMITFTGAVIGYVTNYISGFIENAKSGARALRISGHTVILNWNSRASEIINDLVYTGRREKVVVLVPEGADRVKKEAEDHIAVTIRAENRRVAKEGGRRLHNRITLIVREGDTFSTKNLNDISLLQARTVIILGRDIQNTVCKYELLERVEKSDKGNTNTIKTLVQVADITASEESADNQVIIVEVDDDWTADMVAKIIAHKQNIGKCNIVAVPVNRVLGQLLSQFSIMPELNFVYSELFSNRGAEFFCTPVEKDTEDPAFIEPLLPPKTSAIPLTTMDTKTGRYGFYVADAEEDTKERHVGTTQAYSVLLHKNYWLEQRNIVIVGHNSNSKEIMDGFDSFRSEWNGKDGTEILNVIVIDDQKSLEKRNYYRDYPYVRKTIEADVYDGELIKKAISDFADANEQDTSVLILSDDSVLNEDIDANALTYLIYVQDIIKEHIDRDPGFDRESIDVIVEIVNPKNYDVVRSFSVNNVIISNRYISKMVTQISRKEALYEFYKDILTYDEAGVTAYDSKELYVKKVTRFFDAIPEKTTASQLIRTVYEMTPDDNKAIVLGVVSPDGKMKLFTGAHLDETVALGEKDKLIIFSNH